MDGKATLKALILTKGQELGLDPAMIESMLVAKPSLTTQTDQAQLTGTQLGNLQKTLNITQDQQMGPLNLQEKQLSVQKSQQDLTDKQQAVKDKQKALTAAADAIQRGEMYPEDLGQSKAAVLDILHGRGFTPTKKPAADTATQKKLAGLGKTGADAVSEAEKMYNDDHSLLFKQVIPGHYLSRQFDAALYNATDILLRLRTGAQANESEIRGYMQRLGPSFGDSPADAKYKFGKLKEDIMNETGGAVQAPAPKSNDNTQIDNLRKKYNY